MLEPNYSGIDPLRVPEARRRVAALNEYLALPGPTTADATRISARIGLSRWQFQRLARVWRDHRDPTMLVVGRRGASSRDYGIAKRAVQIAQEEIAQAGVAAELRTVAPLIEQRCRTEGIAPPSRPTIWNYIRRARETELTCGGPPRVVVGRIWFHLPVAALPDGTPGTDMPTLLVAVALPERIVLAHRISLDDRHPPSVAELISELIVLRTPLSEARPLLIDAIDRRAAVQALGGAPALRSHNRSVQRELSRAFAGKLGRLSALYRRALARPQARRFVARHDQRISPEAAKAAIIDAIVASNSAAETSLAAFNITSSRQDQ